MPANEQTEKREQADQENVSREGSRRLQKQRGSGEIDALPSPASEPLPHLDEQPSSPSGGFTKWQTVIWREWSHCKDEDYAYYLFDLIKATAFGWKFVVTVAALGTLLGAVVGDLVGLMLASGGIYVGPWNFSGWTIGPWDLSGWPPVFLALTLAITGGLIGIERSRRFRVLYFWWQGQPSATRVEKALQQAMTDRLGAERTWAEPLHRLEQQRKQQNQPGQLIDALDSSDWVDRFVAQKTLVTMGGEVTEALREIATDKSNPLWEVAIWLLTSIEGETTNLFAWRVNQTLCPHCLTRFEARPVDVGVGISVTYYGCRVCGQSRAYLYLPRGVVAVLDASWGNAQAERNGLLQVNWLLHRTSFDFDGVKIIQATDEDVERFAVQVGNDTDPVRQPRYRKMRCVVSPECELSENTLRILRHTFGGIWKASH